MTDPLALLPLAIAAGGGSADQYEAQQLVAAGLTLLQRSAPLVRALSGRRAAILLPTSPAFLVALAASEGRGAVLVNPLASAVEIARQCDDAGVGAVFTIASLAERVPAQLVRVLLDDAPRAARVLNDGISRELDLGSHFGLDITGEADASGRDEEAAIVYTSAMAGRPLGAILTHRNLLANARATAEVFALDQKQRMLALLPFAHLFGLTATLTAPLLAGGHVDTMARFSPGRALDVMAESGTTVLVGVPTVYHALLAALPTRDPDASRQALDALALCVCGGAELSRELQDRWLDATGLELRQGYGLTEGGPVCLFNRVGRPNVRGSLGVELPGIEVRIRTPLGFDRDGVVSDAGITDTELPDGDTGEICVRGPNVFRGYVGGASGLAVRQGWLHTGDLGRRGIDGSVTFSGLVKPMFTRSGFNVYPREIERAVERMPGVEAAVVRPIAEPTRENDIHLTVRGAVTEADVKRWCQEQLASYKQPRVIELE